MAIPSNPTVAQIVTEGLKRGGRPNPTATEISDATTHALREVKSDIVQFAPRHRLLKTHASTVTARGKTHYALPDDVDTVESVVLLVGPDTWTGDAQAGTSNSLTFAASFSEDEANVVGKYVFLTSGTGANQYRQIQAYNTSNKTMTPDVAWDVSPDVGTSYLIVNDHIVLMDEDRASDWEFRRQPTLLAQPSRAAIVADELWLNTAPDKVYGLIVNYWIDLDRLDEDGAVFVKLLREWRGVWIQGIAVRTMQRFDDERYVSEYGIYQGMLTALAGESSRVAQGQYRDL